MLQEQKVWLRLQKKGLGRESLYKALRPGAHPRYETVKAVLKAVGVEITFKPVS